MTVDPKTVPSISASDETSSPAIIGETSSGESVPRASRGGLSIWLLRLRALLLVTLCATFGVLLVILPWTPKWTDNPLLLSYPGLRAFVSNGFVRGVASGLGLIDLWLGFWEAIHYHEHPVSTR